MDKSKEFLLMLNKAIEQHPEDFNFDTTKNVQDQLQEMIGVYDKVLDLLTHYGWRMGEGYDTFGGKPDGDLQNAYFRKLASMEQFWLSIVMKEKYNKIWDGKDWISNEERTPRAN